MKVPVLPISGEAALREAAAGSYQALMGMIEAKLRVVLSLAGEKDVWPYVTALFPDSVVIGRNGKLYQYAYKIVGETDVELSEPVEVVETYRPVAGLREAQDPGSSLDGAGGTVRAGAFIEAVGEKPGAKYRIRAIRAGLSGNRNFYPDAVLKEAVALFEGVRVFVKSDDEHLAGRGKDVRNLVGRLVEAAFVAGATPDTGEIQATLELLSPDGDVAIQLREAWARNMTGLFGFSIDAVGPAKTRKKGGVTMREAKSITRVNSVDLIVEPGAGGEVIKLIEAAGNQTDDGNQDPSEGDRDMALRERMISFVESKRPDLLKDVDVEKLDDDALEAKYQEAVRGQANAEAAGESQAVLTERLRRVERLNMRTTIGASSLPDAAKQKLVKHFEGVESFTEAQLDQAIKDEREYLAKFTESGTVRDLGDSIRVETGETRQEKVKAMLDAFFDPSHKDHRHAQSFKEAYVTITGDRRVTGMLRDCDQSLLRESLGSTSFDDVLGDSITRRMIADYRSMGQYDIWRQLVTVVPINDFRSQERTRYGGYGNLPAVAEGGAYLPLTSPTDEKATYEVTKRGGTEDVTLEMIKNDDVGVIRQIPTKLGRSAKRTLAQFVLDFIRTNPTIYDSVALFHASHGNLGSAALSASSVAAGRLAMLKQTEKDSGEVLGIGPKCLWVPPDLEETAVDLFRRSTNNDKTFTQSLSLEVMPVWYWTDATDWALSADPMDVPTLEIGFLDGEQEPAVFVQDSPTSGSMFSHDKLTWKIRHIYGGNVLDFRGLYKAVVA